MEKLNKKYTHYIKQNIHFFLNSKKGKQKQKSRTNAKCKARGQKRVEVNQQFQ